MALECGGGECAKFWVQQTGMGTVWSRPSTASQLQPLLGRVLEWRFIQRRALISFQDGIVREARERGDALRSGGGSPAACRVHTPGRVPDPSRRGLV